MSDVNVSRLPGGPLLIQVEVDPRDPAYARWEALAGEVTLAHEWTAEDEKKHPRDRGKFATKQGGGTAVAEKEGPEETSDDWGSKADVVFNDRDEVSRAWEFLIGDQVPLGAVAALVGAPDDAGCHVSAKGREIKVFVEHRDYTAERTIKYDRRLGGAYVKNEIFRLKDESKRGQGLGMEVFAAQVEACRRADVRMIRCHAAGDITTNLKGGFNGYITWPIFGYDQSLEDFGRDFEDKVRAALPEAESVLDVVATDEVKLSPKDLETAKRRLAALDVKLGRPSRERTKISGREWWTAFGEDMESAEFDLSDGSRSMKAFLAYRAGKKAGSKSLSLEGERMAEDAKRRGRAEEPDAAAEDIALMEAYWDDLARQKAEKEGEDEGKELSLAYARTWNEQESRGESVTSAQVELAARELAGGDWHVFEHAVRGWEACLIEEEEEGLELARQAHGADAFDWKAMPAGSAHKWVMRPAKGAKLRYSKADRPPGKGRNTKDGAEAREEGPKEEAPPHRHTQAHEALAAILGEGHEKLDLSDVEGLKARLRQALGGDERPKERPGEADHGERLMKLMSEIEKDADQGASVSIKELRARAGLPKEAFDRAILDLAAREKLDLHGHVTPGKLSQAQKDEMVRYGDEYFIAAAKTDAVHGKPEEKPKAAEKPAPEDGGPAAPSSPAAFEPALHAAFDRLDQASGGLNHVSLVDLRKALPDVPRKDFDRMLGDMSRAGKINLSAAEGRFGISPEERAAGIDDEGQLLLHVSRPYKGGKDKAPAPSKHDGFGKAGEGHPLAGLSHEEQARKLESLRARGEDKGDADWLGLRKAGPPPGLDMRAFTNDLAGVVARYAQEKSVGPEIHLLYPALGAKYGLSKRDFARAMTHAIDAGEVRTGAWGRGPADLPDPELAVNKGSRIMWYLHPPAPEEAAVAREAKRGDQSLETGAKK